MMKTRNTQRSESQNIMNSHIENNNPKFIHSIHSEDDSQIEELPVVISPLAEFLIRRALVNKRLGNYFYWYITSESYDQPFLNQILESFLSRLNSNDRNEIEKQVKLLTLLRNCCEEIKSLKDTLSKKKELLQTLLSTKVRPYLKKRLVKLPLDPDIVLNDVMIDQCNVFKSSLSPLMITFHTENGGVYPLMYKVGDDLRQDQLVVQIISLMNELLKNENVDLKLLPYTILATGLEEGAIQFIPNLTMADILNKYHGILPFSEHTIQTKMKNWE